ncbi:MAG: hypothetical protein IKC89_07195 [Lentisphaeria bacterium]|nr:hypothetical protein [Lentisphaeria bacterium]
MSDAANFTSAELDAAILSAGERFTLASVAKTLGAPRSDVLRRRLERIIESDNTFFYNEKWQCIKRSTFFTGKEFIITPDEWEIDQGILFPGHRFIPFVTEDVFPSEVELVINGTSVAKRQLTLPLGQVFHYHLLLGSEQIFDFLIAENPANAHLAKHANGNEPITLEVFDLSAFYQENNFSCGDALLCKVDDYTTGKITFSALSAAQRSANARKNRTSGLDNAIKQVWEKFRDYPDIPEQLAWAEYYTGENGNSTGASIDEFITASNMVELRADGDHAVLSIREESPAATDMELPPGLSISGSALDDPLKLLSGSGVPLSEAELDGFMLDAIYKRETDIDGVFSRIFGHRELDLDDDAQQAVLLNYLEERFEELLENYYRVDDEPKAELRSDIVDAIEARLEYLSYLGTLDRDVNDAEKAVMKQLAEISTKLSEALKLLDNPSFTPDDHELEHLSEMVDARLDEQEEILENSRRTTGDD